MKASIVIPTVDRRDTLIRAVLACLAQRGGPQPFEIVVVDNSSDGRQSWILDAVPGAGCVRRIHEPKSGLVNARNCGVAHARGNFVAFVDDDEAPGPGWLAAHVRALETTLGDASFGPVFPVFESPPVRLADMARSIYTRNLDAAQHAEVGAHFNRLSTANVCFRAATCFNEREPAFDIRFNRTGGEDTELFRRLQMAGRRLIWARDAVAEEFVPSYRTTVQYMAQRRFSQGQIRTFSQIASVPKRYDKAAFWVGVGAAQYLVHSGVGLVLNLLGRKELALAHHVKAKGGSGKVLWQSRFRELRYGDTDRA